MFRRHTPNLVRKVLNMCVYACGACNEMQQDGSSRSRAIAAAVTVPTPAGTARARADIAVGRVYICMYECWGARACVYACECVYE